MKLAWVVVLAGCAHAQNTKALEVRIAKLEAANAKYSEALEFLNKVYASQKAQQDAEDEEDPEGDGHHQEFFDPETETDDGQDAGPGGEEESSE